MAHDGSPIPVADMIRRYQQELLELQKKSVPVVSVSQTQSALDEEFPAPDIEKDLAALQQSAENEAEPAAPQEGVPPFPVSPPTAEMSPAAAPKRDMSMGYLRVYTSLMQTRFTDESGYTPLFSLPAVNGSYSMSPDNKAPYTYYTVYVYADGFYPVKLSSVPIYGGSTSVQPVDLIPVAEGGDPIQQQTIIEGAPQNLQ